MVGVRLTMTAIVDWPYGPRNPQQSPYDLFRAALLAAGGSTDVQADILDAATGAVLRSGGRYPRRVMGQPNPPVASQAGALQIRFYASATGGTIISPPLPFNDADEQHTAYMLLAAAGGGTNDLNDEEERRRTDALKNG